MLTPQKKNLINYGTYEKCLNTDCEEITQHKTGKCQKCRTYQCSVCKKGFISSAVAVPQKPKCALCARTRPKSEMCEPDIDECHEVKGDLKNGK